MNVGLNCQRQMWPMTCSFWAKEVCTNFRGGLLHKRWRAGEQSR